MKSKLFKGAMIATTTAALAAVGFAPAAHAATTVVTLGPSMVDTSQTRTHGHNVFMADGLHVYTDGSSDVDPTSGQNQDKAAMYWACNSTLADLGDGPTADLYFHDLSHSLDPGTQTVVSLNNDGVVDGILVGERVYNGDFWLANGDAAMQADAPNDSGGSGSEWHGTMPEWAASLPATARVIQCGYSLGSGVQGDVFVSSMTWGTTEYHFSNTVKPTPPTKVKPVGKFTASHSCRATTVTVSVDALGPNQVASPKTITFKETDNGKTVHTATLKPGTTSTWNNSYPANQGTHVIKIFKAGKVVDTYTVQTKC